MQLVMPKKLEDDEQNFSFEFDRVIKVDCPAKSKVDLFSLVAPALDRYCQGFNATVLAYGQTGSGKTYTMGTSTASDDFLASDPRGVVPRAIVHLFNHMAKAKKLYDASLQVSEGLPAQRCVCLCAPTRPCTQTARPQDRGHVSKRCGGNQLPPFCGDGVGYTPGPFRRHWSASRLNA
eukprot:137415-Chlamydomonas_euryale.AAC.1